MKKSERIKLLEEKAEEIARNNHAMEMKLFVIMDKVDNLRKELYAIQNEVNAIEKEVKHEE